MSEAWFAVRTRARAEKVVRDELTVREIEAFLPTVTRWSRWKDRKKAVDWPLFPGYCFARFEPGNVLVILKCPRVAGVVSSCGVLSPIEDHEVDSLKTLMTSDLQYDPAPFMKEGDRVEVIHGSLKGAFGNLIRKGDHALLYIAVDIIAQGVSVRIDASDVRPA